jgi:tetratricopeptide (TPR) repeat protein
MGQYEAARETLGELWPGVGQRPNVEDLGERAAAEGLLLAGALSGWLGASKHTPGAQAAAKDLISESISLFESLGETAQAAAAQSELALCYWRDDAYDEARVLLTAAFDGLSDVARRAKAVLRLTTVEFSDGRYNAALAVLKDNAFIFDDRVSHALRGNFHNLLALVLKQLGNTEGRPDYLDRAVIEYTEAIYHQEKAGHERYRATNENNLANLLRKMGRYREAHDHLDRAGAILWRLKDAGLLAQVDETRARVLIEERKHGEADRVITRAVQTLEGGGAAALLSEALTTQGLVWARLGRNDASINVLRRAVQVAEEAGASCGAGLAALTLIEEHGERRALSPVEVYELYLRADRLLKDAQHPEAFARLRACAPGVMRRLAGVEFGDKNFTIFNAVHELEAKLIEQALDEAGGSVTRAAKLLGVRHQTFLSMLNLRHRKLLEKRRPAGKRLKSIIKKDA